MSSFHNDLNPGVDLALGSLFGHSISFADFTDKNVSLTADRFQIRLRQSAPPLSYRRLKLSPTVFDLVPVHNMPRFAKIQSPSAGAGSILQPVADDPRSPVMVSGHARHTNGLALSGSASAQKIQNCLDPQQKCGPCRTPLPRAISGPKSSRPESADITGVIRIRSTS